MAVPLHLRFLYKPAMAYAPIHEIHDDRNKRNKEFYWSLWFGDNEVLPDIDVRETFVGSEVATNADQIKAFCAIVGNDG